MSASAPVFIDPHPDPGTTLIDLRNRLTLLSAELERRGARVPAAFVEDAYKALGRAAEALGEREGPPRAPEE